MKSATEERFKEILKEEGYPEDAIKVLWDARAKPRSEDFIRRNAIKMKKAGWVDAWNEAVKAENKGKRMEAFDSIMAAKQTGRDN